MHLQINPFLKNLRLNASKSSTYKTRLVAHAGRMLASKIKITASMAEREAGKMLAMARLTRHGSMMHPKHGAALAAGRTRATLTGLDLSP